MNIRKFEEGDKDQVLTLFNEFGDFFIALDKLKLLLRATNYAETFFNEMLENTAKSGVIYVAEEEGTIIGFIGGNFKDLTPENTVENVSMRKGRILEFFITESFRGKGVGKLLMQKLEDYFISNGCHAVNVEVFAQNEGAAKFYSSFGYEARNIDMMKVLSRPAE